MLNNNLSPPVTTRPGCIRFVFAAVFFLVSACSTNSGKVLAPVPVEDRSVDGSGLAAVVDTRSQGDESDSYTLSEPTHNEGLSNAKNNKPVVTALLDEVNMKLQHNDDIAAAAGLERALRLDAKNALLWHRLGHIRLRQKNWQQSVNLAKKSNSLAAGDYALQIENWKLIYLANSGAGNHADARLAAERVRTLKRKLD